MNNLSSCRRHRCHRWRDRRSRRCCSCATSMANVAWAVERRLENPLEQAVDDAATPSTAPPPADQPGRGAGVPAGERRAAALDPAAAGATRPDSRRDPPRPRRRARPRRGRRTLGPARPGCSAIRPSRCSSPRRRCRARAWWCAGASRPPGGTTGASTCGRPTAVGRSRRGLQRPALRHPASTDQQSRRAATLGRGVEPEESPSGLHTCLRTSELVAPMPSTSSAKGHVEETWLSTPSSATTPRSRCCLCATAPRIAATGHSGFW